MIERFSASEKRAEFVKRSPYLYRLAIVKVFRDTYAKYKKIEDHPLGSLKCIIQEMSSYYDGHPDDLKGSFSKKLENILSGKTEGTRGEDFKHFELIEDFLWRYEADEISTLDIVNEVRYLEKFFKSFIKPRTVKKTSIKNDLDIGKVSEKYYLDDLKTFTLKPIDEGYIYKFIHTKASHSQQLETLKLQIASPQLLDAFYLAIKKSQFIDSYLAILFSNSMQSEFCIGCYLQGNNLLIMKHYQTMKPVFLEYVSQLPNIRTASVKASILDIRTNVDISPWGILSPQYFPEKDKDKCINFTGISIVDDIKERDFSIRKANMILKSLREIN